MLEQNDEKILTYYTQQSAITDPGDYAYLFEDLPRDLPSLMQVVQGVLIFPFAGWARHYGIQVSQERSAELNLRAVSRMLEGILALDPAPLSVARSPQKRLYGLCRDFAVLLVAMLRHQGIPARERVGFGGYFNSEWYWDHRITEYWDAPHRRWVLVDPRLDGVQREVLQRKVDHLHITRESPFLLAGEVWQQCRAGQADPEIFVDSPTDRGMPMIRYALLHDFDALNKAELSGMDSWHELISKPEEAVTEADRRLLDEIAERTVRVDTQFQELRALYGATAYGRAVSAQLGVQVP
jgi:hypothetical protein